jgi:hypothetical protein
MKEKEARMLQLKNRKRNAHRYVYIKSLSWNRDTQGLFDYDAFGLIESEAFVYESAFINVTPTDQIQLSK